MWYKMEKESSVYLKIEYDNTLQAEKDLLSSEVFFLNLINLRKKYNLLRQEDLILKNKLKRAIEKMELTIKKAQGFLPKINFPKSKIPEKRALTRTKGDESLDAQLREIQEKLKAFDNI